MNFDASSWLGLFHSSNFEGLQLGHVAIYYRVSTDDQSCARQERDLRAFARRAGHRIVAAFKETASGAKNDRVERKKVMALAQAREIDAILVTELSRWGRSTQDLVQTTALRNYRANTARSAATSVDYCHKLPTLSFIAMRWGTQWPRRSVLQVGSRAAPPSRKSAVRSP